MSPSAGSSASSCDPNPRVAADHLHRLDEAFPEEQRAHDVVAADHPLQRLEVAVEAIAAVEGELGRHDVEVALGAGPVVEEEAFLERRQGIDVLDVGGAAGNPGGDPLDLLLGEGDEGQHGGSDARRARRDGVGRGGENA